MRVIETTSESLRSYTDTCSMFMCKKRTFEHPSQLLKHTDSSSCEAKSTYMEIHGAENKCGTVAVPHFSQSQANGSLSTREKCQSIQIEWFFNIFFRYQSFANSANCGNELNPTLVLAQASNKSPWHSVLFKNVEIIFPFTICKQSWCRISVYVHGISVRH